jgi:polysaccharide export outer membrane protein
MKTIKNIERKIGVIGKLGLVALAMCLTPIVLGGCLMTKQRGVGPIDHPAQAIANAVTNHFPSNLYRLSEGDSMEVMYLTRPQETSTPYKLQVKDSIDVEFTYHPELNRTVRVRPDGKISIPRKITENRKGTSKIQTSKKLPLSGKPNHLGI